LDTNTSRKLSRSASQIGVLIQSQEWRLVDYLKDWCLRIYVAAAKGPCAGECFFYGGRKCEGKAAVFFVQDLCYEQETGARE
jgi:hypothetical protein